MNSPKTIDSLKHYLAIADRVAENSKDPDRKVGSVLVRPNGTIATVGWNEFPAGLADLAERRLRPDKYLFTEHAERNAIYTAAIKGIKLDNTTLYQRLHPCHECARALV